MSTPYNFLIFDEHNNYSIIFRKKNSNEYIKASVEILDLVNEVIYCNINMIYDNNVRYKKFIIFDFSEELEKSKKIWGPDYYSGIISILQNEIFYKYINCKHIVIDDKYRKIKNFI